MRHAGAKLRSVLEQKGAFSGKIEIMPSVIGHIASHAALGCYGVMGLESHGLLDRFQSLLESMPCPKGVHVRAYPDHLEIDLHVIIKYGTRISEVANNLISAVKFEVGRTTGLDDIRVNVYIEGVQKDEDIR